MEDVKRQTVKKNRSDDCKGKTTEKPQTANPQHFVAVQGYKGLNVLKANNVIVGSSQQAADMTSI